MSCEGFRRSRRSTDVPYKRRDRVAPPRCLMACARSADRTPRHPALARSFLRALSVAYAGALLAASWYHPGLDSAFPGHCTDRQGFPVSEGGAGPAPPLEEPSRHPTARKASAPLPVPQAPEEFSADALRAWSRGPASRAKSANRHAVAQEARRSPNLRRYPESTIGILQMTGESARLSSAV